MMRIFPLLFVVLACANNAQQPAADAPLAMRHVYDTWASKIEEPRTEVIRDASRWQEVWPDVTPSGEPPPSPKVDFTREMVVLVARGAQSTGCYLIKVESVARDADGIVVNVAHVNPGPRCGCIAAIGHPVDAVAITRSDAKVRFVTVTRVNDCP